jgi:TPR repeat protein
MPARFISLGGMHHAAIQSYDCSTIRFSPLQTFTCVYQDQHIPPVDPQAELWYEQALELNDPNVWFEKRNWNRIYQLYVQAAERNHWKAMLNLASLILSGYGNIRF